MNNLENKFKAGYHDEILCISLHKILYQGTGLSTGKKTKYHETFASFGPIF
jgi:hypothetical protein